MAIGDIWRWFAGGSAAYPTLVECLRGDRPWIALTAALALAIAAGIVVVALQWRRHDAALPPGEAKPALAKLRAVVVLGGLGGSLSIPIAMAWPAWRLFDALLALLAYQTWSFVWRGQALDSVYRQFRLAASLVEELDRARDEGRRKSRQLHTISHDLKNPLNGLMLQADLAELSLAANDLETLRDALVEIKSSVRITAKLLDRALELDRLDGAE